MDARKKNKPISWVYLLAGGVVGALALFGYQRWREMPGKGVLVKTLPKATREPWVDQGFFQLVPPLRAPSHLDGNEHIEVWIKFAPGAKASANWLEDQKRWALSYPPGTTADRLEVIGEPGRVVDVRGTDIEADGKESFHVYRNMGGSLRGLAWYRDNNEQQGEADRLLVDLMRNREHAGEREIQTAKINNDCGGCHTHNRIEFRTLQRGKPNRPADAAGWYQPQTILQDRMPVEKHRPRDMNENDKFITYECVSAPGAEPTPAKIVTLKNGTHWPECEDKQNPYGVLDVKGALAAGDPHARALCESRKAFREHLDDGARKAFAKAFEDCGI